MRIMLAAGCGLILIGAAAPAERVVSGAALVPVMVKGRALQLRIEPNAPGLPLLPPKRAAELGLKGGGMLAFGVGYRVGRERFFGRTENVKFGWDGGKPAKRRVGWMSRDYVPIADGSIGPAGVPEPVVRFRFRPERQGEQRLVLPLVGGRGLGGALFGSWFVLDGLVTIGGVPVLVRFDPGHRETLVTAPAALALAKAHGGAMTATTGRQEIVFGIERPYRIMKLAQPLVLGGLTLSRVGVRVTDEDVAGRIAEEGAAPVEPDPDEVVVTAKGRKPRTGLLLLGADALAACSSLVFDKPARQIRLSCGG